VSASEPSPTRRNEELAALLEEIEAARLAEDGGDDDA
jgi:hypothetical protein